MRARTGISAIALSRIAIYDLPKFAGSSYLMKNTLGGWQLNAIVTLQTGLPYNVYLDDDQANVSQPNGNVQRPDWVHLPSAKCTTKFYISNPEWLLYRWFGICLSGAVYLRQWTDEIRSTVPALKM